MSAWAAKIEGALRDLRSLIDDTRRTLAYPPLCKKKDDDLGLRVDEVGNEWHVFPILCFDPLGSAAARAPADADYLVKTANSTLSAERVVTDGTTVTWDWSVAGEAKAQIPTSATLNVTAYQVAGTQVVGARGAAVADPAGGATVDTECRTALIALLARVRPAGHGLIAN